MLIVAGGRIGVEPQDNTGFLVSKTDATGNAVTYAYYLNGLLALRSWARGVITTNHYNWMGDFVGLSYSDCTPSVVS